MQKMQKKYSIGIVLQRLFFYLAKPYTNYSAC